MWFGFEFGIGLILALVFVYAVFCLLVIVAARRPKKPRAPEWTYARDSRGEFHVTKVTTG